MKCLSLSLALSLSLLTACESPGTAASGSGTPAAPTTPAATAARVIDIQVGSDGFTPSNIALNAHEKATLRFTRVSDETCAKKVVFPELKLEKDLPLKQAVEVSVPTDSARTLAFQCGMGMFKSSVVIN
ncbi:MAG: cupredoxin domain-containing protein [Myxococcales bacterium]|nr:cupredoxin domain-containing protein [Myxococcales bacterium]